MPLQDDLAKVEASARRQLSAETHRAILEGFEPTPALALWLLVAAGAGVGLLIGNLEAAERLVARGALAWSLLLFAASGVGGLGVLIARLYVDTARVMQRELPPRVIAITRRHQQRLNRLERAYGTHLSTDRRSRSEYWMLGQRTS